MVGTFRKRTRADYVSGGTAKRFRSQGTQTGSRGINSTFRLANRRTVSGPKKAGTLTQQIKSLRAVVNKILPEIKNLTVDLGQTNITTAGTIQHLTAIGAGTNENQRVGEDVTITSIICKGRLQSVDVTAPTAATSGSYYRFVLLTDKQQINDTVPAISDAFSSTDPTVTLPSISFADRFRYLWIGPLIAGYAAQGGGPLPVCNISWKGSIKVGFNGTTAADIQKNGCYFAILTNDLTNVVDFVGSARISFTDV